MKNKGQGDTVPIKKKEQPHTRNITLKNRLGDLSSEGEIEEDNSIQQQPQEQTSQRIKAKSPLPIHTTGLHEEIPSTIRTAVSGSMGGDVEQSDNLSGHGFGQLQISHYSGSETKMEERITAIEEGIERRRLLIAAGRGQIEEVKCLLSKKVNVNFRDKNGNTPLHYAVESRSLEVVKQLLNEKEVDVIAENYENIIPLEIARADIQNQDVIDVLVKKIIDHSFEVLKESSYKDKPRCESTHTELTKVEQKIKQIEDKIESCLKFLEKINSDEHRETSSGKKKKKNPNPKPENISYEQANILIYFIETFALVGIRDQDKPAEVRKYFSQYYTEGDRKVFDEARKRLLNTASKELGLKYVRKFIRGDDVKSFFQKLEDYVRYVQHVKKLMDVLKEIELKLIESLNPGDKLDSSLLRDDIAKFIKFPKAVKEEIQSGILEFIKESYPVQENKGTDIESERMSFFIELQDYVRPIQKEPFFLKTLSDTEFNTENDIVDVGSYVRKKFERLLGMSNTGEDMEKKDELFFDFIVNFYPAYKKETSADLKDLADLRNNLMHDFHEYGVREFGKEMFKLRHTLFKYYYARKVKGTLCNMEADKNSATISKTFKDRLKLIYENFIGNKKERAMSTDEAEDFFGYKFKGLLFSEKDDDSQTLVDQYLQFMVIIDYDNDDEQDEGRISRKELTALARREIFEELGRLRQIYKRSKGKGKDYTDGKKELNKLLKEYGVLEHHFKIIISYVEEEKGSSLSGTVSKDSKKISNSISNIIKSLKKIRDDNKLSIPAVIRLYDRVSLGKEESCQGIIEKLKHLPPDEIMPIRIGEENRFISRRKVVSNILNTFYNAYNTYTIEFNMEEIFNDQKFLDFLVVNETEDMNLEKIVDRYFFIFMLHADTKEILELSSNKESKKKARDMFDKFNRLETLKEYVDDAVYQQEKRKFKDEFADAVNSVRFDEAWDLCANDDPNVPLEGDKVKVKSIISDVKDMLSYLKKLYNSNTDKMASQHKIHMETVTKDKKNSKTKPQKYPEYNKFYWDKLHETPVNIKLEGSSVGIRTEIVVGYVLETFKGTNQLKRHNYMIIKKLLNIDYTAPYIVRLITKLKSDEIIERDDLVRLVEILLMKEGFYIKHLNELLKIKSRKLNLFEEVCNKISEPNFSIHSMRLIFKETQHLKEIFTVLIEKIKLKDQSYHKMVELARKVLIILYEFVPRLNFPNLKEALKIYNHGLKLIEVMNSTSEELNSERPIENNDWMAAAKNNMNLKIVVVNIQVYKQKNEESPDQDQANAKYNENLSILDEILSTNVSNSFEHPQFLIALDRKAYIQFLLGKYNEAYESWNLLYTTIVELVRGSIEGPANYTEEIHTEIENSEKYKSYLDLSGNDGKYLNIASMRNEMARALLWNGFHNTEVEDCNRALKIYKEIYSYRKHMKHQGNHHTVRSIRYIAFAHDKMACLMYKNRNYEGSLEHNEYALIQNMRVLKNQKEMYGNYHLAVEKTMKFIIRNLGYIKSMMTSIVESGRTPENRKRLLSQIVEKIYTQIIKDEKCIPIDDWRKPYQDTSPSEPISAWLQEFDPLKYIFSKKDE